MIEGSDRSAAREALSAHGLEGTIGESLGQIEHVLTHRRLKVHVFEAITRPARATTVRKLVDTDAALEIGVATLTRKILRLVRRS